MLRQLLTRLDEIENGNGDEKKKGSLPKDTIKLLIFQMMMNKPTNVTLIKLLSDIDCSPDTTFKITNIRMRLLNIIVDHKEVKIRAVEVKDDSSQSEDKHENMH